MNVLEVHPEHAENSPDWVIVRDCLRERRVKDKSTEYLKRTSGQSAYYKEHGSDDPYIYYKDRARFPALVSTAVTALNGVAHRLPYKFEAPKRFSDLSLSITPNGESLDELSRKVVRNNLLDGRYGLLSDVDESGNPQIASYSAISIRDWAHTIIGGRQILSYVKLEENVNKSDQFHTRDMQKQYRVLRLVDGYYEVSVYDQDNNIVEQPSFPTKASGEKLDYIPFSFIGSVDLTPACDESPLLPMARSALSIYKLDAVYMHSLYMTGEPTPVISGVHPDEKPKTIGSSTIWVLSNAEAKAYYLEFAGAGIEAQRTEIEAEFKRAERIGGDLGGDSSQAESGEALKLRMFSRHATLFSVAQVSGAGIEQNLKWCADFIGINPDEVSLTPNLDFTGSDVTDALIKVFNDGVLSGTIAKSVLNQALRDGGHTELTDDQIALEIEESASI